MPFDPKIVDQGVQVGTWLYQEEDLTLLSDGKPIRPSQDLSMAEVDDILVSKLTLVAKGDRYALVPYKDLTDQDFKELLFTMVYPE